jgi:FixJ family two-component response regulator
MPTTRLTVIVIDDDESVRRALGRLLRSSGLKVESFATAEEFLQAAAGPLPGCLVLDVHLPGLSGPELRARLSAEGRDAPVVYVSGYEDEGLRDRELRTGAVAFLRKPFEEQSLLDAVAGALAPRDFQDPPDRA